MYKARNIASWKYNLGVFLQFIHRDLAVYRRTWHRTALNFGVFTPLTLTFCFGYLVPTTTLITPTPEAVTLVFIGSIVWAMFPLSYTLNMNLLLDFEGDRFINYQIQLLPPILVLIERIVFTSAIVFIHSLIFYPISKLILGKLFDTSHVSIPQVVAILYMGSVFCTTYNVFCICFMKGLQSLRNFWLRFNFPLIQLGGFMIPWVVMYAYSPLLGTLMLANPFIYLTEGLRHSITGGSEFFSFWVSILGLVFSCIILTLLAFYFFKKKVDHI